MNDSGIIVGFDLGNYYSQISYYDELKAEPVCIGKDEEQYIPTVLGVKDTGEWLAGREALSFYEAGRCTLITDFLTCIQEMKPVTVMEKQINYDTLLCIFFEKHIFRLKEYEPVKPIRRIVITTPNVSESLAEHIYNALSQIGIKRNKVDIINYKQSYLYYVLSHSTGIWVNDVGMFDFSKSGLMYYQLYVDRSREPYIAGVFCKDYSDNLNYEMLTDEKYKDSLGYLFENIVQNALRRQTVSTLYLIGDGFLGGWAQLVMKKLCGGRRVFAGRNLYVLGACFAARKMEGLGTMKDFVMIDDDMISSHISLSVYVDAGNQDVLLAKAGSVWYDIDNDVDVIPDNESELQINITNILTRETSKHFISLETLGIKDFDRKNRINVRVRFQSVNKCIITIRDLGFGSIVPSNRRICERIIEV